MKAAVQLLVLVMIVAWTAVPVPVARAATKKSTSKTKGGFTGATPKPASSSAPTPNPFVTPAPAKSSTATEKVRATPSPKSSAGKTPVKPRPEDAASDSDASPAKVNSAARRGETRSQKTRTGTTGTPKPKATAAATEDAPNAKTDPAPEPAPSTKVSDDPEKASSLRNEGRAPNATIRSEELVEFAAQPVRVQQLIDGALALTRQQLTYEYGSADPSKGGMDCSGTIYYLLRAHGFKDVPRDSPGQYTWARKSGGFRAVVSNSPTSFEFEELQPGDLMFWSGTYNVKREMPVTHVMLYLGTEKKGHKRVMFGASDGRTYDGVQRWGVSVFDFKMPRTDAEKPRTDFLGYGRIPGLRADPPAPVATNVSDREAVPKPAPVGDSQADEEKSRAKTETARSQRETQKEKVSTSSAARKKTRK